MILTSKPLRSKECDGMGMKIFFPLFEKNIFSSVLLESKELDARIADKLDSRVKALVT